MPTEMELYLYCNTSWCRVVEFVTSDGERFFHTCPGCGHNGDTEGM